MVDGHGVPGTHPSAYALEAIGFRRDSRLLQRSQEAHSHTGVVAVRSMQDVRQPLISQTLGSYFAEAGIALAKSAHVTRMKFCSFRNFLNSSLLTRSISF